MLCWLQFLSRSIVRPKTCCKNETQPTASNIPMNNTIEFEKKLHLLIFFQIHLYCHWNVWRRGFVSFLQQVLGRTIDLLRNCSRQSIWEPRVSFFASSLGPYNWSDQEQQPVKHYRASCLVFCNKSWAVQLICSRLDQINCTAQDLMQKMRREALECLASYSFWADQLYGPRLVTKNEDMMLDNALLAVVLDQINCSQMLCWLQLLSRSIARRKTCCKKRIPGDIKGCGLLRLTA